MTKYTHEVRRQVIDESFLGKSTRQIARKFNMGQTTVTEWINRYNMGGVSDATGKFFLHRNVI